MYAIDLLGFGGSAKPNIEYSMELWRDLVVDFMAEFVQQPAVVMGNSIGGLTALMVGDGAAVVAWCSAFKRVPLS